jgi:hypothetical protein
VANKTSSQLKRAMRNGRLVRLSRRFENYLIHGYIFDVGPKFFLLALVSDHIWFDGFECFRISDVKKVNSEPNAKFVEAALKKRGEQKPKKPAVSVETIQELLVSASESFPLVTIHRDVVSANACWIGRVLEVSRGNASLLEINPDASWDKRPSEYRLSEITRVGFGAEYEEALHLVGGDSPKI